MTTIKPQKNRLQATLLALGIAALLPVTASATVYDMTAANTTVTINGAIFTNTGLQSTGTGVIDPFLRLQANGSEAGLNSNEGQNDLFADTKAGIWTNDITLGDIGVTTINSIEYFVFLLDINQTNANPLINLDILKLYTRATSITDGNQDDPVSDLEGGAATLAYDLDAGGDNTVKLDYSLNSGSGSGDLFVYVPTSLFGAPDSSFLYMHTAFGSNPNVTNDGFEEWSTVGGTRPPHVPDNGTTAILLGTGLIGLAILSRRRMSTVQ
jgi:hypothetical protein